MVGVDGSCRATRRAERLVVNEDQLLELLQLRPRVEAELIGQMDPHPPVRGQCIGLASGPVLRGDQQFPQGFLVGVRRHGHFQLADDIADVAEPQPRRELGLDEAHPCLFEPCLVRVDPIPVPGGREQFPAVPLQCRRAQVGGSAVVADVEQTRNRDRIAQHGQRIDLGRIDGQLVAVIAARR